MAGFLSQSLCLRGAIIILIILFLVVVVVAAAVFVLGQHRFITLKSPLSVPVSLLSGFGAHTFIMNHVIGVVHLPMQVDTPVEDADLQKCLARRALVEGEFEKSTTIVRWNKVRVTHAIHKVPDVDDTRRLQVFVDVHPGVVASIKLDFLIIRPLSFEGNSSVSRVSPSTQKVSILSVVNDQK